MRRARDIALKTRWISVDELIAAPFHTDLFPLPRDLSLLRRSFARHGFRAEYPLVVRVREGATAGFDIICGVGRHAVAIEQGMRRVPAVVRRFEGDEDARSYAIEDALFGAGASPRPSLAHMVVLAQALREYGRECAPREVWEAAGVSPSTYWRAARCVDRALKGAVEGLPPTVRHDPIRLVAEVVRREMSPRFTLLLAGEVEVNTLAVEGSRQAEPRGKRLPKKSSAVGSTGRRRGGRPPAGGAEPGRTASDESPAARRGQRGGKDSSPSLFDLLPA